MDNQLSNATTAVFDETSIAVANITNILDDHHTISVSPEPNNFGEKVSDCCTGHTHYLHPLTLRYGQFFFQTNLHNGSLTYSIPTPIDPINSDDELKKCAGEILNGIKRTVEVQVVNPPNHFYTQESSILGKNRIRILSHHIPWLNIYTFSFCLAGYFEDCFPDYLNPVPKDQIVRESGLRSSRHNNNNNNNNHSNSHNEFGNDYFVTELDPIELGINMSTNSETEEVLFGDDFNLNYFGIVAGNNIMAW